MIMTIMIGVGRFIETSWYIGDIDIIGIVSYRALDVGSSIYRYHVGDKWNNIGNFSIFCHTFSEILTLIYRQIILWVKLSISFGSAIDIGKSNIDPPLDDDDDDDDDDNDDDDDDDDHNNNSSSSSSSSNNKIGLIIIVTFFVFTCVTNGKVSQYFVAWNLTLSNSRFDGLVSRSLTAHWRDNVTSMTSWWRHSRAGEGRGRAGLTRLSGEMSDALATGSSLSAVVSRVATA